jgi:hypothetical protein
MHFTVENLVMNGGSLTPRKPTRPNQRLSYMCFDRTLNKAPTKFYLQLEINLFSIPAPWKTSRGEKRSLNGENTYDSGIYSSKYFQQPKN